MLVARQLRSSTARVRRVQLRSSAARVRRVQLRSSAARVRRARLRVANTAARLVLADTRCKVIVIRAELAGAVRAHPRAARAGTDLERHTAIRASRRDKAAVVVEIKAVSINRGGRRKKSRK